MGVASVVMVFTLLNSMTHGFVRPTLGRTALSTRTRPQLLRIKRPAARKNNASRQMMTPTEQRRMLRDTLLQPVDCLYGVGAKWMEEFAKLGITSLARLLNHLPNGVLDRRKSSVIDAVDGEYVTIEVKVMADPRQEWINRRPAYVVECMEIPSGEELEIVTMAFGYFGTSQGVKKIYPLHGRKRISGKVTRSSDVVRIYMPDFVASPSEEIPLVEPKYPLTAGLKPKVMRQSITNLLEWFLDEGREVVGDVTGDWGWDAKDLMERHGWKGRLESLHDCHNPASPEDIDPGAAARTRVAYDEILAFQVGLALRREIASRTPAPSLDSSGLYARSVMASFQHELTSCQESALREIRESTCGTSRMVSLLQGDVGSGKTIIASLALLDAVEAGTQGCLLAPTEVLASQHYQTLTDLCKSSVGGLADGTRVGLLTGAVTGKARESVLKALANGDIDILIGTHAVLNHAMCFKNLGLAVIDEEQRFGVSQREKLTDPEHGPNVADRRKACHVLYMTATPIPRTLSLAMYGDMKVIVLKEKPTGAASVQTTVVSKAHINKVLQKLKDFVDRNEKIIWVLPLIELSEKRADRGAAIDRYEILCDYLGENKVALLHGKLSSAEKNNTMSNFSGRWDEKMREESGLRPYPNVLVATSIIEVGVDISNANICIIENAELFGLSQLHQMRGRVGRAGGMNAEATTSYDGSSGERQCHCVLLHGENVTEEQVQRLTVLRMNQDGFDIADEDLKLRGPGEALGTRQRGLPAFKTVDLDAHSWLFPLAYRNAQRLVAAVSVPFPLELLTMKGQKNETTMLQYAKIEEAVDDKRAAIELLGSIYGYDWTKELEVIWNFRNGKVISDTDAEHVKAAQTEAKHVNGAGSEIPTLMPAETKKATKATATKTKSITYTNGVQIETFIPTTHAATLSKVSTSSVKPRLVSSANVGPKRQGGDVRLKTARLAYVLMDVETTGLYVVKDRIVQLSAKVETATLDWDHSITPFDVFCDPQMAIPAFASDIHGITQQVLRQQNAVFFPEAWARFTNWLEKVKEKSRCSGVVLVAHNCSFDRRFLEAEALAAGLGKDALAKAGVVAFADTLAILKDSQMWVGRTAPPAHKLQILYKHVVGTDMKDAHSAVGDVAALDEILSSPHIRDRWKGLFLSGTGQWSLSPPQQPNPN